MARDGQGVIAAGDVPTRRGSGAAGQCGRFSYAYESRGTWLLLNLPRRPAAPLPRLSQPHLAIRHAIRLNSLGW